MFTLLLTLVLAVGMLPTSALAANAETQYAMFLFKNVLKVTCNASSHGYMDDYPYRKATDIVDPNAAKANVYAPFDCKVVYLYSGDGNAVVIESIEPVYFADGTTDYMTIMVAHDNDISDIKKGNTYRQGEVFYQQGNAGIGTGNHVHVEIARGAFSKSNGISIWSWMRDKSRVVDIDDALYLYSNTNIKNDGGYTWHTLKATTISLNKYSLNMKLGTCTTLTATTDPKGQSVTWTSSNPSVATVDGNGNLNANQVGTTTITAKMTYKGQTYTATCKVTVSTSASVTTQGADSITTTSAIVRGAVTVPSGKVTECGMYIGTSKGSLKKLGSDKISKGTTFYYSTSKYGYTLKANTTYYYQAYAIVDGTTFKGEVKSFKTPVAATVTTKGADNIKKTSAIVRGAVTVSSGKVTECGMYIGTSASNLKKLGSDKISKGTTFYYSTSKYGYTLKANATYYYRAYAIVDGMMVWGSVKSFKTSK